MRHAFTGAVVLSVAAFHVGAAAQEAADRPLSRSLTVEQAAVYDIRPPARPAAAGGDGLEVLAWVDRPDYTYASGEDVRLFVETSKDAYVTVLNVDPAGETTVLFPNRWQSDNFVAAGRALEVPRTFAELREVGGFFTRKEGDMLAGETLERDVYGWADALGAGVGITRSFIVILYSAGIHGWDENFQPDVGHPIVAEVAEYFVDLAKNTAPREAQNWGFLEGLEMFRDGRLAMATMWPQGVGIVETEGGDAAGNVGYSPLPVWEGNLAGYTQGTPFLGGGGVFIFDAANSDEAFKFLKWMLQDNEVEWGKRSEQFSRKMHFQSEELRTLKPFYGGFLPAFEQVLESVFIRQGIPEYGAVMWSGATDFITDVYSGDLTPEQAQDRWVERMTEAFKAAGYIQ